MIQIKNSLRLLGPVIPETQAESEVVSIKAAKELSNDDSGSSKEGKYSVSVYLLSSVDHTGFYIINVPALFFAGDIGDIQCMQV